MSFMNGLSGGFTLPGEAGYEDLTLRLAEKWGADVIRDSDGTKLSPKILDAGYEIYATLCIIRDHNEWAKKHPDTQQQVFLISSPVTATGDTVEIPLLERYFADQFSVNHSSEAMLCWQVFDRTQNVEVPRNKWRYDPGLKAVQVTDAVPWHRFTASFLAFRVWEEINMYNHITNHWTSEHLMQLDPIHPAVQDYLLEWLEKWCVDHPKVDVVRFTSLFYNFAFIWGSSPRNRYLFSDWASYDNTASPLALAQFEQKKGYALTAEDFINKGNFQVTHWPPTSRKRDYMDFVCGFVAAFGKKLVDTVHRYGKKAFVFYDDSWVGMEPYGERFSQIGFDGLIKCVFSGYEARLCAHVPVKTHELRLHPYLFPVGLSGAPTFQPGGNPALDAKKYWLQVRRALLRAPVQRIGLGGYLHLTEGFPEFCDYIGELAQEFRQIKALHESGEPYTLPVRVAVLHSWGKLRSWSLSGHFHETDKHDLIHINEALSGLPVHVCFLSFEDVKAGALKDVQVVINAGAAGTAWSGGDAWADPKVVEKLTGWVHEGGAFIGVNEPSACLGSDTYLRMAHVLGVDLDTGEKVCHGRWKYEVTPEAGLSAEDAHLKRKENVFLTDGKARVLQEEGGVPAFTVNGFGRGKGIYLTSFKVDPKATRFLLNLLLYAAGLGNEQLYLTDNLYTECAFYPAQNKLAVVNMSGEKQTARISVPGGMMEIHIEPYGFETRVL
jgi:beta-D-galactosyl-(1->4)-L-rhamnose phosphorylase